MKTSNRHTAGRWVPVEQLRAGDTVALERQLARVILVENADQKHVLVAYEGRDNVDYRVGTKLRITSRA
jgi:hypothetical protein